MIVSWVVLAWYQRVTDGRSDRRSDGQTESIIANTALFGRRAVIIRTSKRGNTFVKFRLFQKSCACLTSLLTISGVIVIGVRSRIILLHFVPVPCSWQVTNGLTEFFDEIFWWCKKRAGVFLLPSAAQRLIKFMYTSLVLAILECIYRRDQ